MFTPEYPKVIEELVKLHGKKIHLPEEMDSDSLIKTITIKKAIMDMRKTIQEIGDYLGNDPDMFNTMSDDIHTNIKSAVDNYPDLFLDLSKLLDVVESFDHEEMLESWATAEVVMEQLLNNIEEYVFAYGAIVSLMTKAND